MIESGAKPGAGIRQATPAVADIGTNIGTNIGQAVGRGLTASWPRFLRFPSRPRSALNCRAATRQARNRLRIVVRADHSPSPAITWRANAEQEGPPCSARWARQ